MIKPLKVIQYAVPLTLVLALAGCAADDGILAQSSSVTYHVPVHTASTTYYVPAYSGGSRVVYHAPARAYQNGVTYRYPHHRRYRRRANRTYHVPVNQGSRVTYRYNA